MLTTSEEYGDVNSMKQIDKNTVKAENQLSKQKVVTFINPNGKGKRIMFVGNSITRHDVKPDIGWYNDWGMAATSLEKDYVHIMANKMLKKDAETAFCICHAAEWERNCYEGEKTFDLFKDAHDFNADIIIMRIVENCPQNNYNDELFLKKYAELIAYLNNTGKAEVIITTGFWKHIADDAIRECAKKYNYPLIELSDLGEDDSMKAIGLFEHSGVANHPGDKGIQEIANRVLNRLS